MTLQSIFPHNIFMLMEIYAECFIQHACCVIADDYDEEVCCVSFHLQAET